MALSREQQLEFILQYVETYSSAEESVEEVFGQLKQQHPELTELVTELLSKQKEAEKWMKEFVSDLDQVNESEDFLQVGDTPGNYKIIKKLDTGGMSQVYLAERADDEFEQLVAVKVLDTRFYSSVLMESFKQEKNILARLNHPNIGQIFDSGFLDNGQPYYVMEYIKGVSLNEYVASRHLNNAQRLELVEKICNAVSFAHRNLVIHKDIKPGNILIDENGHVKLLDFGVANSLKMANSDSSHELLFVTRKYASPEMLRKQPVNISSDIYQLGLLTFWIIAGYHFRDVFPDHDEFGFEEKDLSSVVSKNYPDIKLPDKELSAILRKALMPEPEKRYGSVNDLKHDIENYRFNKPVETYSNSASYLISKFIKRNQTLSRVTLSFFVIVTFMSVLFMMFLHKERVHAEKNANIAQEEAARSEATLNYLKNLMYQADPFVENEYSASFLDSLAMMAYQQLDADIKGQPEVKAELFVLLADIFRSKLNLEKSFEALFKARNLLKLHDNVSPHQKARVYAGLASTYTYEDAQRDSALFYIRKALAIDSMDTSVENKYLSYDLEILARIYAVQNKFEEAIKYYSQSLTRLEKLGGREAEIAAAGTKSMLGEIYKLQSDFGEAEKMLQEAIETHTKYLGQKNGYVINDIGKLAALFLDKNEFDKSKSYSLRYIELIRNVYGPDAPKLISAFSNLSSVYAATGQYDSAIVLSRKGLNLSLQKYGDSHIKTARRYNNLGLVYHESGHMQEAIDQYRNSLDIKVNYYPKAQSSINITRYNLANSLLMAGKSSAAIEILEQVYAFESGYYGEQNATIAFTMRILAQAYIDNGRLQKAERILSKARPLIDDNFAGDHRRRAEFLLTTAELAIYQEKYNQGFSFAKQAFRICENIYKQDHWRLDFARALYGITAHLSGNISPESTHAINKGTTAISKRLPSRLYYHEKLKKLNNMIR